MQTAWQSINGQTPPLRRASSRLVLMSFILSMSFLVLFLTYLPATLYGSSEPVSSIPEQQYDFGQVVDGSEVEHDYLIKNRGTGVLKISDVNTG